MALNGKMCGGLIFDGIKPILEAKFQGDFDFELMRAICDAIGEGIVAHITTSAQVQGSVTSGAGAGGAVTGKVL